MKLVLFDIDGTLIDSGGAGIRALDLALRELFSIENGFQGISMAGRTDTHIIKEGLSRHGIPVDGNLPEVIKTYLSYLSAEIHNNRKKIKPGIYEVLEILDSMDNILLGLLTGNIEQGARIKLSAFDLNRYFPAGAFGSDDEDRNLLLPFAVKRFEALSGTEIPMTNCIVIGDTPRDVHCAKPYGAFCIGVATGPYTMEALEEAGADHVMEDLSDRDRLLGIIHSVRTLEA
jgi:phosphoglycolate phosphatase-like HAD superfamily hydrolase